MSRLRTVALLLSVWLLANGGCGDSRASGKVVVFAAASLTACFEQLAREFEQANPGVEVTTNFAGTPQLVLQVREGAPADVFASADEANMQRVVATGRVAGEPAIFARNRLVIVVAKGNPKAVRGLADLAHAELRVALCGPEVPAGRYARQALGKAGVAVQSVSDEPSVKAVVNKVTLGEIDAGVVYVTDAVAAQAEVDAVAIPDQHNVVGSYPIAVLQGGGDRERGERFVAFVRSDAGQAVLQRFGFGAP